jgi:MOSC domain-containing protein
LILVGSVTELWRYPVKSVGGERCHELDFDARGAAGDRGFALYGADGKIGSGKTTRRFRKMDGLLHYSASLDDRAPVIACPDGSRIRAGDPAADAALSAALGEAITVRPEHAVPHFDVAPVHLLSTASLRWLAARMGDADAPDVQRFRPNILLEVEAAAERPEDDWVGRTLLVGGSVRLHVVERAERCVMTTMSQGALGEDGRVLRTLGQLNDGCFGVYASVRSPGRVSVGDSAHLLAEPG